MKFSFNYNEKDIELDVEECKGFRKGIGLMFKSRNTKPLLFDFEKETREPIHSVFVFFSFLAVWLDDKNEILEKKIVRPFTIFVRPKKSFRRLLEIPFSSVYFDLIKILDGKHKV